MMQIEFEMSMMRELRYFLELQIYQTKEETFINQAKYLQGEVQNNSNPNVNIMQRRQGQKWKTS